MKRARREREGGRNGRKEMESRESEREGKK